MASSDQNAFSDEILARYLLGDLPMDQVEKLDELSVTDDELAWRLSGVENDLVDGFVRGELQGDNLKRFRFFYLASARRRQKVEFAAGLLELEQRSALPLEHKKSGLRLWSWLRGPGVLRQWSIAAAALALLLAAGYLLSDNLRLRRQVNEAANNASQHEQQLEQELTRQRAANAQVQNELEHARGTISVAGQLNTVALLLAPPTRGASKIENVAIQPGTDLVVLLLSLEADDFPHYRVTLKDPASQQEVWHSHDLISSSTAGHKTVAASIPAKLLRQQRYLAELSGVQRNGSALSVGNYPFAVVVR